MISLKIKTYSRNEVQMLYFILREAENKLTRELKCNGLGCKTCEYRHVCYALSNAAEYLEKKIKEDVRRDFEELLIKRVEKKRDGKNSV